MKEKFFMVLVFVLGMIIGQIIIRPALATYTQDGAWTAVEKSIVITLLEKIERNTRP